MCAKNFGFIANLLLVFFVCVDSSPIIIRTGLIKNQGQHQQANLYDAALQKGISNFEDDEGFNRGNERKHVASADTGNFAEENGERKNHLDQSHQNKEQFFQNGGGSIADIGNKVAHKKGHHKTGFSNHYHKDEQGSNSSFFDDAADEGDQYMYRTQKGTYGNQAQGRHRVGNMDNAHYANEGLKRGLYDQAGAYDRDLGDRQQFHRKNYYDGREHTGRQNAANDYGENGRYHEERYMDKPHHYGYPHPHPHPPPHAPPHMEAYQKQPVSKRRITIYEDPRYMAPAPAPAPAPYHQAPRYADDYVELDVVRPEGRHYARRSPHGYY